MVEMQSYFDRRLTRTGNPGIRVSRDLIGNSVYESLEKREGTLAGEVPASLVASREGTDIIARNPGLLPKIYGGIVEQQGAITSGYESRVYQISLATEYGKEDFALKYTFPMHENIFPMQDFIHTSGIVAMRIMQLASKEKPVPSLHYVTPIFATHDITVAPFIEDRFSMRDILDLLTYSYSALDTEEILQANALDSVPNGLKEILQAESVVQIQGEELFGLQIRKVIDKYTLSLKEWVDSAVNTHKEFSKFHFDSSDTSLAQSVVVLQKLSDLYKKFKADPTFNAQNEGFVSDLLGSLHLVELGIGTITKEY